MKNRRNHLNDFRQRVNLYFDNALSEEDQKELMSEVQHDPKCQREFTKEKSFRDFIRNNVKRSSVSPDLIQSIRDKIRIV